MSTIRCIPLHHALYRILFAVLVVFSTLTRPSEAVTITNLTSNTVVFADNFENGSFTPSVGSWSLIGPAVSVTNSTTTPDPGPIEGTFYAKLFRDDATTFNEGALDAMLSTAQTTSGDVIHLEMMVFLPNDGANARGQFMLSNGNFTTSRAWVRPDGLGNVIAVGPGLSLTDTGIDYLPDTWQRWELTYMIGSSIFSVSVDGISASGFTSPTTGGVSKANLFNGSATPGSVYLDASPAASPVPEPASVMLLGVGVVTLVGLRRWLRQTGGHPAIDARPS